MWHVRLLAVLASLAMLCCAQGCIVGDGLDTPYNPDMSVLKEGALRTDVEEVFGRPYSWYEEERAARYEYVTGDVTPGRRTSLYVVNEALSWALLPLWHELGTSPIAELDIDERHVLSVWYSEESRVLRWDWPYEERAEPDEEEDTGEEEDREVEP